jgi:hypothetical protein
MNISVEMVQCWGIFVCMQQYKLPLKLLTWPSRPHTGLFCLLQVLQNSAALADGATITNMVKMLTTALPRAPCKGANWRDMWVS